LRKYLCLLATLFMLNLADAATTIYGLSQGATELNPLYNPQNLQGKISAPIILATTWIPTYAYCRKRNFKKAKRLLEILLLSLVSLYVAVVYNNLIQLAFAHNL